MPTVKHDEVKFGFSSAAAREKARRWIAEVCNTSRLSYNSREVETRFGTTHLLDTGEVTKPAILFLPGWGTCGAFWDLNDTLAPLAEQFRIVLLDVPGQPGLSTSAPIPLKGEGSGQWLLDVMDQLNLETAHFAGASFGGFLLLQAQSTLKTKMKGLVLCAPAGLAPVRPSLSVLPSLLWANVRPTLERSRKFLQKAILGSACHLAANTRARLDEIVYHFQKNYRSASLPPRSLSPKQIANSSNVLVVCGAEDRMIAPPSLEQHARRKLGETLDFRTLAGHGHSLEMSPEVVAVIAEFLQQDAQLAA